jgi:predicted dehydrogenase
MSDVLRVGIAGYGVVGQRRHGFISERPDMRVVAVCDRALETGSRLEDGTPAYSNYKDLLVEPLDALFVCISNDMAAEVTMAGLRNGLHVFCEKPPGRTLKDISDVIDCHADRQELKLKYGFNHRYHDSVQKAFDIIRTEELGAVVNLRGVYGKSQIVTFGAESDWRTERELAGGGILLDQGIHMVDLLRLFAGEFVEVKSFVSNSFWNHSVEDNAYALMRTGTGVIAMLHSSATQWRHRFSLDITLERGTLILEGILSGTKSYGQESLIYSQNAGDDRGNPEEQVFYYDEDPSWALEIEEFAQAILEDRPIENGSAQEAFKTMQLVYQIYCADNAWRTRWNLTE